MCVSWSHKSKVCKKYWENSFQIHNCPTCVFLTQRLICRLLPSWSALKSCSLLWVTIDKLKRYSKHNVIFIVFPTHHSPFIILFGLNPEHAERSLQRVVRHISSATPILWFKWITTNSYFLIHRYDSICKVIVPLHVRAARPFFFASGSACAARRDSHSPNRLNRSVI